MSAVTQIRAVKTRLEPGLTLQPWGDAASTPEPRGCSGSHLRTSCFLRKPRLPAGDLAVAQGSVLPSPIQCFPCGQKLLSSARLGGEGQPASGNLISGSGVQRVSFFSFPPSSPRCTPSAVGWGGLGWDGAERHGERGEGREVGGGRERPEQSALQLQRTLNLWWVLC